MTSKSPKSPQPKTPVTPAVSDLESESQVQGKKVEKGTLQDGTPFTIVTN